MDIYEPAEDSYLLQKFVRKYASGRVLDLGTGSGIQALTAAGNSQVKEVIAADTNETAVAQLQEKIKKNRLKKIKTKTKAETKIKTKTKIKAKTRKIKIIKVIKSNLFEKITGKFDTIIFNPPYLPQDSGIEDAALYGGKKGWELSEQFFARVSKYLSSEGIILFLFSSLTDKKKIEEIIFRNLLRFRQLGAEKIAFEELFVYEVCKTSLLIALEGKGITGISYFTHGKRGDIFTGRKKKIKVAIKVKRKESKAVERIQNEAGWLKVLNKKGIGPRLLFYGRDFLVYKFVDGDFILDWTKDDVRVKESEKNKSTKKEKKAKEDKKDKKNKKENKTKEIKKMLVNVLKQCFTLDLLKVNKEEMHHPYKHVLINKKNIPVLIDFERCHKTSRPQNVTQFVEFICRREQELKKKNILIAVSRLRAAAKKYKNKINEKNFKQIEQEIGT
ncbi:MAG: methyltransferase [Nanoarchaeota archaeon]